MTKYNTSKQDDVKIYKVNIEEEKLITAQFEIKGVPTMIYMQDKKIVAKKLGVRSVEQLKDYEKEYFSK